MSFRSFYTVCIVVCSFCLCRAQNDKKYVDSMEQAIKQVKDPYKKARKLLKLSDYFSYRDTAMAFRKIKEAENLMKGNRSIEGLAMVYRANVIYDTDIERSQKMYLQAEEILKDIEEPIVYDDRAILWHNYAALEQLKGNERKFAAIIIEKCIPLVQKGNNTSRLAYYYVDVGMSMNEISDFRKSESYLNLALEIERSLNTDNSEVRIWTLLNMANMYVKSAQSAKAKMMLAQCEKELTDTPDSQYSSMYYVILTQYYINSGEYSKAYISVEKGLSIAKKLNIPYDVESLEFEKYQLLKSDKKYNEAADVLKYILSTNVYGNPKNKLNYLKEMSEIQKKLKNYDEALHYLEQHNGLNDSLGVEEGKKNIQELERKYNTSLIEQKLLVAEKESRMQKIIFAASVLLLLCISGFGVYAYFQKKKKAQKELIILEQQKNLEVSIAIIAGEEHERKRIAKELHDGISGNLTGIKLQLENIDRRNSRETVCRTIEKLEAVMKEVRHTARNLMPETLLDAGLDQVLKEFCNHLNSEETKVQYYSAGLSFVKNKNEELNILRIVQELVTNAVRHGKAQHIIVQLTFEKHLLMITVEDDGKGFDFSKAQKSLGLANVENRVKSLNGTIHWETAPGQGTSVNAECDLSAMEIWS